jgi:hypothetical protein
MLKQTSRNKQSVICFKFQLLHPEEIVTDLFQTVWEGPHMVLQLLREEDVLSQTEIEFRFIQPVA